MYAAHFGLRELPFNNTPDPRFFFATPDHEEALASLICTVSELKGYVLLTGEVGAGKTLVSRMMLRHFGDRISSAVINNTALSADDLLAAICSEFKLTAPPSATRFQLVRALQDYLLAEFAANRPAVLVLDEAQNLPQDAFEQLRMIGNLEADDAKLLQVVIVGQPELRERFNAENMRPLRQRIFRSYHLPALARETCAAYIRHRLTVAGLQGTDQGDSCERPGSSTIFEAQAIDVIHEFSQGLPRLINTACDNAMITAYAADRHRIDGPLMRDVIAQITGRQPSPPAGGWSERDRGPARLPQSPAQRGVQVLNVNPPAVEGLERRITNLESCIAKLAERTDRLLNRRPTTLDLAAKDARHIQYLAEAIRDAPSPTCQTVQRLTDACRTANQVYQRLIHRAAPTPPPAGTTPETAAAASVDDSTSTERTIRSQPQTARAPSPISGDPAGNSGTCRRSTAVQPNRAFGRSRSRLLRLIDRSRPMLDALETLAGRTRHMVQNPNTESAAASAGQGELEPGPHGACPATASTDLPGTPPCPTAKLAREIGRLADFADNPPSSADPLSQPGPG